MKVTRLETPVRQGNLLTYLHHVRSISMTISTGLWRMLVRLVRVDGNVRDITSGASPAQILAVLDAIDPIWLHLI
jgi:hypothetical protein